MSAATKKQQLPAEIMVKVAEAVLEISGRQVRRLYSDGVIEGRFVGRVLLLKSSSVLKYKSERRPAGRPLDTLADGKDDEKKRYNRIKQREHRQRVRAGGTAKKGRAARTRARK